MHYFVQLVGTNKKGKSDFGGSRVNEIESSVPNLSSRTGVLKELEH
jgi:hypothetical protein